MTVACSVDSKLLLTACDDMHSHLYDVANGALIEAFSGNLLLERSADLTHHLFLWPSNEAYSGDIFECFRIDAKDIRRRIMSCQV